MFTATTVPVQVQLAQDILPVSYVNIDSIKKFMEACTALLN